MYTPARLVNTIYRGHLADDYTHKSEIDQKSSKTERNEPSKLNGNLDLALKPQPQPKPSLNMVSHCALGSAPPVSQGSRIGPGPDTRSKPSSTPDRVAPPGR